MKRYIMESKEEIKRLEEQTKNPLFSLCGELKGLTFTRDEVLLDAGCGTGLLGRYLKDKYPKINYYGCDQSLERLVFAKNFKEVGSSFFECDLYQEKYSEMEYDTIISRYVFHHLENPQLVAKNFYNNLKDGGRVIIIDAEGVLLNIGTGNQFILECVDKINKKFYGNLMIARHLPRILIDSGFKDVQYKMDLMDFQKTDRKLETEQFYERIKLGKKFYVSALGDEITYYRFKSEFLNEISKDYIPFFYNRFIVSGIK